MATNIRRRRLTLKEFTRRRESRTATLTTRSYPYVSTIQKLLAISAATCVQNVDLMRVKIFNVCRVSTSCWPYFVFEASNSEFNSIAPSSFARRHMKQNNDQTYISIQYRHFGRNARGKRDTFQTQCASEQSHRKHLAETHIRHAIALGPREA